MLRDRSQRLRRALQAGLVVSLLAAALTACTVGPEVPSSGPLAVHPRPEAGMDALLEGTLRTDGDCIRVDFPPEGDIVPSFPAGDATWDEAEGVLTWRDEQYADGDPIALGGGFGSTNGASGYMPEACAGLEVFIVSPF
jgi:hypothetical protein